MVDRCGSYVRLRTVPLPCWSLSRRELPYGAPRSPGALALVAFGYLGGSEQFCMRQSSQFVLLATDGGSAIPAGTKLELCTHPCVPRSCAAPIGFAPLLSLAQGPISLQVPRVLDQICCTDVQRALCPVLSNSRSVRTQRTMPLILLFLTALPALAQDTIAPDRGGRSSLENMSLFSLPVRHVVLPPSETPLSTG